MLRGAIKSLRPEVLRVSRSFFSANTIKNNTNPTVISSTHVTLQQLQRRPMSLLAGALTTEHANEKQKERVAIHEAGHAVVGHYLGHDVEKISIISSDGNKGYVNFWVTPSDLETKSGALDCLCRYLAGRAAEELFGEAGFSARGDLKKAKALAREMVDELGLGSRLSGLDVSLDVDSLLQQEMKRAKVILEVCKKQFECVKTALMNHNELNQEGFLKAYRAANDIYSKNVLPKQSFINTNLPTYYSLPTELSIKNIAKGFGVEFTKIRQVNRGKDGNILVYFKLNFPEQVMKEVSDMLTKNNVGNVYLKGWRIEIPSQSVANFINYLDKQNQNNEIPDLDCNSTYSRKP